jgi:hypothetical protein
MTTMFRHAAAISMMSVLIATGSGARLGAATNGGNGAGAAPTPTTRPATTQRFDVRAYGAVGDGVADDQLAITRAAGAVAQNKGGVLYLPFGVYRCARQAGEQNAIEFFGVSDVTVLFDPGAVLLMDNLNPKTGAGDRGHGILVRGPCHNITLANVAVKWATRPSGRSMGDAFRFEGFPSDDRCISDVRLLQCSAQLSPQTGAVLMGCSDIYVENFRVTKTYADGLHFNACRRIQISGLTGIETGDDTLSFATYYDEKEQPLYGDPHGPFSRADLGDWNCTGTTATNIYAKGGTANGVRLAGALDVSLSNVIVEGKLRGVIADCGKKEANKHSWSWLASRGINITNLTAIGCTSAFYVSNFNQPMTGDDRWWRFDVQLANLIARNCKDHSLLIGDAAGVTVHGVRAENQGIHIRHARDCALSDITLRSAKFLVNGQADASARAETPNMKLSIRNVDIDEGYLELTNCKGLKCGDVRITRPVGEGLRKHNVVGSDVDGISID